MVKVIECGTLIALLLRVLQDLLNSLYLWQVKLLKESVEGGAALSPVLSLTRGRSFVRLPLTLPLQSFLDGERPLFNCGNEVFNECIVLLELSIRLVGKFGTTMVMLPYACSIEL